MAGYGHSKFGKGPFGRSDLGEDTLIETFPEEYFDDTIKLDEGESLRDNNKDPLLKILKTYKNSVQKRRLQIDSLQDLLDYEKMPLEIAREWGEMLGLGIDKNDPDFLQRSLLGNASQWLQIKGSKRGYEVRGLASGFEVFVDNFWKVDPSYIGIIPAPRLFYLKPSVPTDDGTITLLHTDAYPGEYPLTPTEEDQSYIKSAYLRITFQPKEPRRPNVDYNFLYSLLIDKIKDVVAIHHDIFRVVFQIVMQVAVTVTADFERDEKLTYMNANVQGIYDIDAADVHPTDDGAHLTVTILPIDEIEIPVNLMMSILVQAFEDIESIAINSNPNVVLTQEVSFTPAQAYVVFPFDDIPADENPLDGPISVGMVITEGP